MQLAPNEIARRTVDGALFRHDPVRLSMTVGPVITRDGHELTAGCALSARLVERDADLDLFKEQLLAEASVVTVDTLRRRLTAPLRASMDEFAKQHDAAHCLTQRPIVAQLLLARANEIGFGCGIEFLPPVEADLHCPTLDAQRVADQLARQKADRLDRAAGALQHLKERGSLALLSAEDQATVLQLLLGGQPAQDLLVVAGAALVRVNPQTGRATPVEVGGDVGPFRSVQPDDFDGQHRLLLGGQRGVIIHRLNGSASADQRHAAYFTQTPSERGFNSVAFDPALNQLVATHSELGLLRWNAEDGTPLTPITTDGSARFVTRVDERFVFATDQQLLQFDGSRVVEIDRLPGRAIDLLLFDDSLVVVCDDGHVVRKARSDLTRDLGRFNRAMRLFAAAPIDLPGLRGLVLAGESGPVECFTLDGRPLLEFHGPYRGLRMLARCGPHLAGVTPDRQQVVVWDAARPDAPARQINIAAQFGHRIADLTAVSV